MPTAAELERRLAALERRIAGLSAIAPPAFGGEQRPMQVGFPVQLTSAYSATTGYSWQQLILTPSTASVGYDTIPRTGDGAVTPDNNVDLASGTRGWLEVDPQAGGWLFTPAGAAGPSLPVVTNVCVEKNGSGYVTSVTCEWRAVTLPAGSVVSDPVCATDADDCCDGADAAGAATITFSASAQTPGTPTGGTASITFAASATSAGGSGGSAGSATITFAAAATSTAAVGSGSATITFGAVGFNDTDLYCTTYNAGGIHLTALTTDEQWSGLGGTVLLDSPISTGADWLLTYVTDGTTWEPTVAGWSGIGSREFTRASGTSGAAVLTVECGWAPVYCAEYDITDAGPYTLTEATADELWNNAGGYPILQSPMSVGVPGRWALLGGNGTSSCNYYSDNDWDGTGTETFDFDSGSCGEVGPATIDVTCGP